MSTPIIPAAGVNITIDDKAARFQVSSQRNIRYSIVHPSGYVFDAANPALENEIGTRLLLAVVDRNIDALYGPDIWRYLSSRMNLRGYVVVEGCETAKNWTQVQHICDAAIQASMPRNGVIMAIGGGVTLDIAGFAAAVFRRGVNYVRVPTSLIGLVDVGVGIKQGINVGQKKSIVGAFYPAMLNINDPTFLTTIPQRHLSCGMAEIIKMAVVRDAGFFSLLEQRGPELISSRFQDEPASREVLLRAEQLMLEELQPNLFEEELRRLPDFGHTFSPVIETASGHSINHGEAVAMDMLLSTAIAVVKGLCQQKTLDRLRDLLIASRLPLTHSVCTTGLLFEGLNDVRAHRGGDLNMVVPYEMGRADFIQHVSWQEIEEGLAYVGASGGSWRHASALCSIG